jgi:acyl-CoA thioesterase FadM
MGVVRAQGLEVIDSVGFGEELILTMWLSHVGKTSLAFSHSIERAATGALVATSTATIVALDSNRRPSAIDETARVYLTERPSLALERLDFDVPAGAYARGVDLRPSDQDLQRHVNHARYADFVEDTRAFASEASGYGPAASEGLPRRLFLAYEREARVGESVAMATWSPAPKTLDFALKKGDGTLVTRARLQL